ncbi:hypothetical protein ACHAPT_002199 [Fusarium lateritium]
MATYLITQATGQQSQWVIRHLLEAGAKIHAVVRDVQKVPPVLKEPGVTLFQGESKNFDDVFAAAKGCKGTFLNTVPWPGLEALQAKTIVEASEKAGVETIVASTTILTDDKAAWDNAETKAIQLDGYYSSKTQVEDIVRAGKFQAYTILRPAVLHHDFYLPGAPDNFPRLPTHGELDDLLVNGSKVPYTDAHDLGKYAAAALQDPAKFEGKEIDLANELLTFEEVRDVLVGVSGREVRVVKRTTEELDKLGASVFGQKFHLFSNIVDLSSTPGVAKRVQEEYGIPFTPLAESVKRDKARLLESLPSN